MVLGIPRKRAVMPAPEQLLPGRATPMPVSGRHLWLGQPLAPPYPPQMARALFGMGCFWGAERRLWQAEGVHVTAVGYAGGGTPNPTYEEVCSGLTGHNEVVLVVYDPAIVEYWMLLRIFWESHDPTQGMRQGNDVGTQYRSGIYVFDQAQRDAAETSRERYQAVLDAAGRGRITTEILAAPHFYFAEPYHQQYLIRNPNGYCGLGGTGLPLDRAGPGGG